MDAPNSTHRCAAQHVPRIGSRPAIIAAAMPIFTIETVARETIAECKLCDQPDDLYRRRDSWEVAGDFSAASG
jgi:hypothetical protein